MARTRTYIAARTGAVALWLTLGLITASCTADRMPASTAREAARRDEASPEGKAWKLDDQWLARVTLDLARTCAQSQPDGARTRFSSFLWLAKSGAVLDSIVDPETPYSRCFRDGAKALTFVGVPREGFWLEVEMQVDRGLPI